MVDACMAGARHAGYIHSGPVAAIAARADEISQVVLLGPHEAQAPLALVQLQKRGQRSHWIRPSSSACQ